MGQTPIAITSTNKQLMGQPQPSKPSGDSKKSAKGAPNTQEYYSPLVNRGADSRFMRHLKYKQRVHQRIVEAMELLPACLKCADCKKLKHRLLALTLSGHDVGEFHSRSTGMPFKPRLVGIELNPGPPKKTVTVSIPAVSSKKKKKNSKQQPVPRELVKIKMEKARAYKTKTPRGKSDNTYRIRKREFIGDLTASGSTFAVTRLPVNPTAKWTDVSCVGYNHFSQRFNPETGQMELWPLAGYVLPFLGNIAKNFAKAAWNGLKLAFDSDSFSAINTGSAVIGTGSVLTAADGDALSVPPADKQAMLERDGARTIKPQKSFAFDILKIVIDRLENPEKYNLPEGTTLNSMRVSPPGGASIHEYVPGYVDIGTVGVPAGNLGSCYLEYDVTLSEPIPASSSPIPPPEPATLEPAYAIFGGGVFTSAGSYIMPDVPGTTLPLIWPPSLLGSWSLNKEETAVFGSGGTQNFNLFSLVGCPAGFYHVTVNYFPGNNLHAGDSPFMMGNITVPGAQNLGAAPRNLKTTGIIMQRTNPYMNPTASYVFSKGDAFTLYATMAGVGVYEDGTNVYPLTLNPGDYRDIPNPSNTSTAAWDGVIYCDGTNASTLRFALPNITVFGGTAADWRWQIHAAFVAKSGDADFTNFLQQTAPVPLTVPTLASEDDRITRLEQAVCQLLNVSGSLTYGTLLGTIGTSPLSFAQSTIADPHPRIGRELPQEAKNLSDDDSDAESTGVVVSSATTPLRSAQTGPLDLKALSKSTILGALSAALKQQ